MERQRGGVGSQRLASVVGSTHIGGTPHVLHRQLVHLSSVHMSRGGRAAHVGRRPLPLAVYDSAVADVLRPSPSYRRSQPFLSSAVCHYGVTLEADQTLSRGGKGSGVIMLVSLEVAALGAWGRLHTRSCHRTTTSCASSLRVCHLRCCIA